MTMSSEAVRRTALVIGAGGGLGYEVTRALLRHGWRVRALLRDPEKSRAMLQALGEVECVAGDAARAADVVAGAAGVSLIVHAVNPPRYRNWRGLAIPMLQNAIAAARQSGARLMFPGNVYNYAPDVGGPVAEDAPQRPSTRKGAVRVEMEAMLREAARTGVRSVVVRAGDFFGGHSPSSNFTNIIVKPGRKLRSVTYPGDPGVGHAWAYLPDLAETFAEIADREHELPAFDTFHFSGHWFANGIEMAHAVRLASGQPNLPIRGFPWLLLRVLSPFVALFREVLEMRYLWERPLALDNRKLVRLIGREPRTPLDVAVHDSLRELGCLA
jgi:nucleoside-diphosphate-sugar epimerase